MRLLRCLRNIKDFPNGLHVFRDTFKYVLFGFFNVRTLPHVKRETDKKLPQKSEETIPVGHDVTFLKVWDEPVGFGFIGDKQKPDCKPDEAKRAAHIEHGLERKHGYHVLLILLSTVVNTTK